MTPSALCGVERAGGTPRPPSSASPRGRRPPHVEEGLEGGRADERERIVVVHPPGRAAQERAAQTEGIEPRPEPTEITKLQPRSRQRYAEFLWGDEHVPIVSARCDQVQPLLEDLDHEQPGQRRSELIVSKKIASPIVESIGRAGATPDRAQCYDRAAMSPPKKHHYVPRSILRNFSVDGARKQVHVFDKSTNRSFLNAIGDAGCETHFNTVELNAETISFEEVFNGNDERLALLVERLLQERTLGCLDPG